MNQKSRAISAALMLSILKISLHQQVKIKEREMTKAGYAHCDTNAQDGFRRLSCLSQNHKIHRVFEVISLS